MGHFVFSNLVFVRYIEQVIFELIPKEYNITLVYKHLWPIFVFVLHSMGHPSDGRWERRDNK